MNRKICKAAFMVASATLLSTSLTLPAQAQDGAVVNNPVHPASSAQLDAVGAQLGAVPAGVTRAVATNAGIIAVMDYRSSANEVSGSQYAAVVSAVEPTSFVLTKFSDTTSTLVGSEVTTVSEPGGTSRTAAALGGCGTCTVARAYFGVTETLACAALPVPIAGVVLCGLGYSIGDNAKDNACNPTVCGAQENNNPSALLCNGTTTTRNNLFSITGTIAVACSGTAGLISPSIHWEGFGPYNGPPLPGDSGTSCSGSAACTYTTSVGYGSVGSCVQAQGYFNVYDNGIYVYERAPALAIIPACSI